MMPADRTRRWGDAARRAAATAALAAVALAASGGCQKALFPKDAPRTQFELTERMRKEFVPLEEPDVFGNPQPNLRGRLTQRD